MAATKKTTIPEQSPEETKAPVAKKPAAKAKAVAPASETAAPAAKKAAAPAKTAHAKIRIQYYRSKIQAPVKHKLVVKGLGFTRLNQIVEREDTASIRGMVKTVPHLVRIVESK
jgi:large subunit ribosomal protein L30